MSVPLTVLGAVGLTVPVTVAIWRLTVPVTVVAAIPLPVVAVMGSVARRTNEIPERLRPRRIWPNGLALRQKALVKVRHDAVAVSEDSVCGAVVLLVRVRDQEVTRPNVERDPEP